MTPIACRTPDCVAKKSGTRSGMSRATSPTAGTAVSATAPPSVNEAAVEDDEDASNDLIEDAEAPTSAWLGLPRLLRLLGHFDEPSGWVFAIGIRFGYDEEGGFSVVACICSS
jgi:hypothetical protein